MLLITHDLEQALVVADRVVVFYEGRSIEEARVEDFARAETLKQPYTRALWRAMPRHGFVCPGENDGTGEERLRKEPVSELEARNLTFRYKNRQRDILKDVCLKVKSGEIVGLTAPSGYGKTTLCKLLAGYEKPREGEILLDEKPLKPQKGSHPVQMIWQQGILAVDPRMRMKEILQEGGKVQGRILDGLGIQQDWMNRFPSELSGGELQRFCIARALGPATRFLLADEITAMLDLISQCRIWRFLIREARERNLGILVVSHNTDLLERICDRIEHWD